MSYYFGFTLQAQSILVSDQKRSQYNPDGSVKEFLQSKIWKIRDDLYFTSAGNLGFAEQCVVKAIPQVVQDKVLSLNDLAPYLTEWQEYFQRNFKILEENSRAIDQLRQKSLDPALQDDTSVLFGGVDERNTPFLLRFHSLKNFKPELQTGSFQGSLLALCPEGASPDDAQQLLDKFKRAIERRLTILRDMPDENDRIKRAVKIMPEIIAMAAKEDSSVSREYDLIIVGPNGPQSYSGRS